MEPTKTSAGGPARASAMKRYGPLGAIVVIGLIVALIVALTSGGSDDKKATTTTTGGPAADAWPLYTEATADAEDWGPNCDAKLGKVKIPWTLAAPCAKQLAGDNGGATADGVTADRIKIVVYQTPPELNPLQSASVRGAGADVSPESAQKVYNGYFDLFQQYYNFYGRTLDIQYFRATGGPMDEIAARADALAIAELKPFAVISGANQTPVWAEAITAQGILCMGNCSLAVPAQTVEDNAPYLIGVGPTPEQAGQLTAEFAITQLKGGKAIYGGDDVKDKKRVFAVAHYNTVDNQQGPAFTVLKEALSKGGIDIATDTEFALDVARGAEQARTVIAKLRDAGATTVIYTGDPITPGQLTKEATAQGYFPEWVIGSNVLVDIAVFGRTYDQEQWKHAFGLALTGARVNESANQSKQLYRWFTGNDPENNTYGIIIADLASLMTGIHLAGPDLTPDSLATALQRAPIAGGTPFYPRSSRGEHGLWPTFDWGGSDDTGIIWWNPEANGENEIGVVGDGLYEYTNMGERYTFGKIPKGDIGLFREDGSITIFETVPKEYQAPSYPSPAKK